MAKIKNDSRETRSFAVAELRLSKKEGEPTRIVGYAAVFDKLSEDFGGWREQIAPGAFAKTIKNDDIRALVDHDSGRIIGRNSAGTLTLSEDKEGLKVEILPPDTQVGRDIVTSIERGDVSGMSFGFRTITDNWRTVDEEEIRTLEEVKLFDVSPVTFPAYPDTDVGVRSYEKRCAERSGDEGADENETTPADTLEVLEKQLDLAEIE